MTPEVLSPNLDKTTAQARFQECVSLAKMLSDAERAWAKLGRLLCAISEDQDYLHLGFETMDQCIMEISLLSDYSRSSLYRFKTLFPLVFKNAGVNTLEMRIGSADAFLLLPEHLQRDERIQMWASELPEKFKATVREQHPEVHFEEEKIFKVPESRWLKILETLNYYRQVENDPEMSDQQAMEECLVEYMSLRQQLEAMAAK